MGDEDDTTKQSPLILEDEHNHHRLLHQGPNSVNLTDESERIPTNTSSDEHTVVENPTFDTSFSSRQSMVDYLDSERPSDISLQGKFDISVTETPRPYEDAPTNALRSMNVFSPEKFMEMRDYDDEGEEGAPNKPSTETFSTRLTLIEDEQQQSLPGESEDNAADSTLNASSSSTQVPADLTAIGINISTTDSSLIITKSPDQHPLLPDHPSREQSETEKTSSSPVPPNTTPSDFGNSDSLQDSQQLLPKDNASKVKNDLLRTHYLFEAHFLGNLEANAPHSGKEITRNIANAKESKKHGKHVYFCVPKLPAGIIQLRDFKNMALISYFQVKSIIFCAQGEGAHRDALGFTVHTKLVQWALMQSTPSTASLLSPTLASTFPSTPENLPSTVTPFIHRPSKLSLSASTSTENLSTIPDELESQPTTVDHSLTGSHSRLTVHHARTPSRDSNSSIPSHPPMLVSPGSSSPGPMTSTPNPNSNIGVHTSFGTGNQSRSNSPNPSVTSLPPRGSSPVPLISSSVNNSQPVSHVGSPSLQTTPAQPTLVRRPSVADKFSCQIFRFSDEMETKLALKQLAKSFGRFTQSSTNSEEEDPLQYEIELTQTVLEADQKGTFLPAPIAKDVFKVRAEHRRRMVLSFVQTSPQSMLIADVTSLVYWEDLSTSKIELQIISREHDERGLVVVAEWPSTFVLDDETPKYIPHIDFRLQINLLFVAFELPFPLVKSFKVRAFKANERFWYQVKKEKCTTLYRIRVESTGDASRPEVMHYGLGAMEEASPAEKETYMARFNKMLKVLNPQQRGEEDEKRDRAPSSDVIDMDPIEEGMLGDRGGDEGASSQSRLQVDEETNVHDLIISGTGTVQRLMTETTIESWTELLANWEKVSARHKVFMVRKGIPEPLRHQVWQLLVGGADAQLMEDFRFLLTRESATEQVIQWDLARTFPAHDYFKDGGPGQAALFRLNKAYSIYDEEIGYCQGLSFISAVLLLHMPEEEAFDLFVKIMFQYGVRDLFKHGFDQLKLKFFQLEKLLEEFVPEVHAHLRECGISAHMYASQWFLTLFASKFSLPVVYRIMDVFLSEGADVLFTVSLALLKLAKKDLLQMGFEEILHYFRVTLPRCYHDDASTNLLIETAAKIKLNAKKVKKYEEDYHAEMQQGQDPVARLEKENEALMGENLRLETEAQSLARELVAGKIEMRKQLDKLEEQNRILKSEGAKMKAQIDSLRSESADVQTQLEAEISQIKDMYRKTIATTEAERNTLLASHAKTKGELEGRLASVTKERDELAQQLRTKEALVALSEANPDMVMLQQGIHDTEVALAQAKLQLAESESRCQMLEQHLSAAQSQIDTKKKPIFSSWLNKKQ